MTLSKGAVFKRLEEAIGDKLQVCSWARAAPAQSHRGRTCASVDGCGVPRVFDDVVTCMAQVVTYKWLSREHGIPYDTSKQLLYEFMTAHRGVSAWVGWGGGWGPGTPVSPNPGMSGFARQGLALTGREGALYCALHRVAHCVVFQPSLRSAWVPVSCWPGGRCLPRRSTSSASWRAVRWRARSRRCR